MAPGQRIGKVVGDVFVELVVFVVLDFSLIARHRACALIFSRGDHGFTVFLFLFSISTGRAIWSEYLLMMERTPVVQEIIFAFTQVQGDFGAAIRFGDVINGVFTFTFGFPEHAVFRAVTPHVYARSLCPATINARIKKPHTGWPIKLAVFRWSEPGDSGTLWSRIWR